jgi:hypothetical protein
MSKNPWVHPFDVLSVELFAMAAVKAAERSVVEAQKRSGAAATMAATVKSGVMSGGNQLGPNGLPVRAKRLPGNHLFAFALNGDADLRGQGCVSVAEIS